jgi:hypothetical protein
MAGMSNYITVIMTCYFSSSTSLRHRRASHKHASHRHASHKYASRRHLAGMHLAGMHLRSGRHMLMSCVVRILDSGEVYQERGLA